MNESTQLLRIIQMLRLFVNPVFLIPLQLKTTGFSASKITITVLACFLTAAVSTKIYFFTLYKLENVQFYIEIYHLVLATFLSILSYIGYIVNSGSLAKILNNILSQSKPIADQVFCRKVGVVLALQLLLFFGIPFSTNVWCNSNPFFFSDDIFWLFTVDVWVAFIFETHLTSTGILFSNAILLCRQTIAKVNSELLKIDCVDGRDSAEVHLMGKEKIKVGWTSPKDLSEDGLASLMALYNNVCQNCADLNGSYGCSVACTYVSNLMDMILVAFYTIKYGVNQLWIFIIINFCYFLTILFILFACESFTKEVQKTGIIVNRLMVKAVNQRQKELFQQFSIFLLHRKIKFTAWGLFNLDYKMVYSTLSMAVTYLALVYQFETKYKSYHG